MDQPGIYGSITMFLLANTDPRFSCKADPKSFVPFMCVESLIHPPAPAYAEFSLLEMNKSWKSTHSAVKSD